MKKYYRIDNSVMAAKYTKARPKGSLGEVQILGRGFKVDPRDDSLFVPSERYAPGYFKLKLGEWLVVEENGQLERYSDDEFRLKFSEVKQ